MNPTVVWLRQDLRLGDNPALAAAAASGGPVIPVYIWSPEEEGEWAPGAASRWWLHHALKGLQQELRHVGSRLVIRRGPAAETLQQLVRESAAGAVLWNRRYEPHAITLDAQVESALRASGTGVQTFNSALLVEPTESLNRQGKPYAVFTAFWNANRDAMAAGKPIPAPTRVPRPRKWPPSLSVEDLQLLPRIDWAAGFREYWHPQGDPASILEAFLAEALPRYPSDRDRPALHGTSRLSPFLHWGQISPRQIWHAVAARARGRRATAANAYLRQLAWREFAHHLLYHFPDTVDQPLRPEFQKLAWRDDPEHLAAWQQGRTGYPLVDAGMRELWHTGWMHNRVRLVVASFLTKDLLIPWQSGARWFWDPLVDADLANNTLGWQWVAGCGADAAPYFRVLNPVLQGERFDPAGGYVRKWVPELAGLPDEWIHQPCAAPPLLADAGVQRGRTYPHPIVDHAEARKRALAAFERMRSNR